MEHATSPVVRGRGRPVGADSEQTRRTILRAARDVIAECGYAAATFQQIATRAGVSRPTLHYYFGTREQVYETLLAELHSQVSACVAEAQERPQPRLQLIAFTAAIQRLCIDDPAAMRFLVAARVEQRRGPHRSVAAQRVIAAVHDFYTALVEAAQRSGELAPGAIGGVADMLASLFWGMGFHAGFVAEEGSASIVARQLLQLFDDGLLTSQIGAPVDA
ncbi:TetR/AcrR family transcriptional regulator [Mycolicibacterium psychrotolerans]|uniref:TetR/AcrR family transcriptional regulator n=1 Tax=Mycolicibacterium psychrotolerans TaxID=216929 RepID=UPI001FE947AA|nr:TetR/AcrR family transcriptional regulator [Mycolicibacterium psychrotolerans]